MKNYHLSGKYISFILILLMPLLMGSSNRSDKVFRFSLINRTVFTPGSDVAVNLYSSSRTDNYYRLKLFRINDVAGFFKNVNRDNLRYNFDVWGGGNNFLLSNTKLIKSWTRLIKYSGYYGANKNLDVGKIKNPGYYILQALSGGQVAYCGIAVSDFAVVYKYDGKKLLAFTANSASGKIAKKVSFSLYDRTGKLSDKNTGKDGLAIFNIGDSVNSSNGPFLLIGKTSGETVLSNPYFYFNGINDYYTAYFYTNQPVYRPGQTVYFKALMRQNNGDGFNNVAGQEFSVKIRSHKNKEVYSGNIKTNRFGAISGNFILDNEADLGHYSVVISKGNRNYYGSFDVEEYRKPEYLVNVLTAKKQYSDGDTVKINVSADYYFGSPVTDAKVHLKIYRRHYWRPWWYWSEYAWFYRNLPERRINYYGNQELIYENKGRLDKYGKYNYDLKTRLKQEDDYVYIITAEVTDNSRLTVTGESEIYLTRGSFSITTSPERYFVSLGEPVSIRINTADFSNKPVSSDFKVVVNYPAAGKARTDVISPSSDTLYGRTDTLGKASVSFLPKMLIAGNYRYTVYASDEKGRIISSSGNFYMGSENYYFYGRSGNKTDIETDKDSYKSGDSLTAYIYFPDTGMDALVTYASKNFIDYKVYPVDKNYLTVKIKLTGKYAPGFNIDVTYLKDNRLYNASKMIGVLDTDKFLTITAKPSLKVYKPGEKAEYTINVRDSHGNPVENADLSVGVVDESIYAVKEDDTPDIKTFFYAPGYYRIPTFTSLQNANFNGVSRPATLPDLIGDNKNLSPAGTGNLFGQINQPKGQYRYGSIYILLSGKKYFYSIKTDTAKKYMFTGIKKGSYEIIALLGGSEFVSLGTVDVGDQTLKNIDLSNYTYHRSFPGPVRPLVREELAVSRDQVITNSADISYFTAKSAARKKSFVKPEVRSNFADAAFWKADIVTDINGNAEVSFKLPDNLTTWRTTIKGITGTTIVGQDTNKIISRKNLLIRLETPRFLREGDELILSTIVHNYLKNSKLIKVNFNPGDLSIIKSRINQTGYDTSWQNYSHRTYQMSINSDSQVRIDWLVKVINPSGFANLNASVYSDEESDAVKLKLPVWPEGIKIDKPVVAEYASERGEKNIYFNIPDNVDIRSAKLTFSVAPSLAAAMLKSIDDLVGYPYGCVEQTMSRFLPTVIVANTFRTLNAPLEARTLKELPKMVEAGLKRLYNFQHPDGGWGWWTNDKTNPYMTAYVIYGLSIARKAGYNIDNDVFYRGLANLKKQISGNDLHNFTTESFMLYALSAAQGGSNEADLFRTKIDSLLNNNLNSYALSLLALSEYNLGNTVKMSKILNKLSNAAITEDNYAYWGGKAWHYSWHNDKVQTTAFAVKALLLRRTDQELVFKAVSWLMTQKQGFSWRSTQQTAAVLFALTDYLKQTHELQPNFNISVYLNNVKISDKNFTKSSVFNDQPSVTVSGLTEKILHNGSNKITIIKSGPGTAYISGVNEYYSKSAEDNASSAFRIKRTYYLLKPENTGNKIVYIKEKTDGEVKVGDILLVKTSVETDNNNLQYFILEDMLPAGFETIKDMSKFEIRGEGQYPENYTGIRPLMWFYADKEYRDDRVSFFVTDVQENMNFSYLIRAQIPGDFNVSPAQGYLMYYPEVSGSSSSEHFNISE